MKIKTVSNGFIVELKDLDNSKFKTVIESNEDCRDFDPHAIIHLINIILEDLGIFVDNRKYEKENISIEIKHGTHYDCADKDCEICNGAL